MSTQEISVSLQCCGANVSVVFHHFEAPALPAGHYRKSVVCPDCQSLVILSLQESERHRLLEQELIDC